MKLTSELRLLVIIPAVSEPHKKKRNVAGLP
jgi:hypothetical protein